jgi:hypothetical protein
MRNAYSEDLVSENDGIPVLRVTAEQFREAATEAGWKPKTIDLLLMPIVELQSEIIAEPGKAVRREVRKVTRRLSRPVALGERPKGKRRLYIITD